MTAQAHTDSSAAGHVPMGRLWFGFLAGPTVWATQEMVAAAITGWTCADAELAWGPLSGGGVRVLLALITLVAIAVVVLGLIVAWRGWNEIRNGSRGTEATSSNTAGFMCVAGLLVGSLSLVGLLYTAVPLFFVESCGKLQ